MALFGLLRKGGGLVDPGVSIGLTGLPIRHAERVYGIEPCVMAGDIYTQAPYVGRGGWRWYTGAAAWMHRAAVESILGPRLGARTLSFTPCLPSHWPQAGLTLMRGQGKDSRKIRFILIRPAALAELETTAPWGAQIRHPGDLLAWPDLPPQSCFVIPLPPLPDSQLRGESETVADRIVTSAI